MKKTWRGFLLTSIAALSLATNGWAATVTVTNTNDSGAGSLRAAISSAANGDTIDFNLSGCPCTITTATVLTITKNLIISGPGASQLTVSGANTHRVFSINGTGGAVTISGLTIADGNFNGTGGGGGMTISNAPASTPVTISNCVLSNNTAALSGANSGYGGAIFFLSGTLTVVNTTFSNNHAGFAGGAIATLPSGGMGETLTIVGCTIANNTASPVGGGIYVGATGAFTSLNSDYTNNTGATAGGGIYNLNTAVIRGGSITLNHLTSNAGSGAGLFTANTGTAELSGVNVSSNNTTSGGTGGGLAGTGLLAIVQCIISNNQAGQGGGIETSGSLSISNSTVAGNMAVNSALGFAGGGGINQSAGSASITDCTISANTANGFGGGINNAGSMTVSNSTISGNQLAGAGGQATGGGICSSGDGTTNLSNCTIVLNTSQNRAGGVSANDAGTVVNVDNSIIAQNSAPNGADLNGTFVSIGYNLIGTIASATAQGFTNGTRGDIVGTTAVPVNPLLAPLADNGGPTQTHALQDGSPAIDKGNSRFAITTDQRGEPRFVDVLAVPNAAGGNFSDIGAFETTPLQLIGAASRKTHGSAGTFDVELPVIGAPGIEDRSSNDGVYTVVLKFTNPVTAGTASVTAGTGSVSDVSFNGSEMLVNLTGVANAQYLTVTANNVADLKTHVLAAASVNLGVLIGDTNGNRAVNAADISETKALSGATVTVANFREDISVNGQINAADVSQVKAMSGTALPTPPGKTIFGRLARGGSMAPPNDTPPSRERRFSSR